MKRCMARVLVLGMLLCAYAPFASAATMQKANEPIASAATLRWALRQQGPQGDFYSYVNEDWLAETQIPEGYAAWSDVSRMHLDRMKEIGEIVYSLHRRYRNQESFPKGSSEQKIVDVFAASSNAVFRDSLGLEPAKPYLAMIDEAKTLSDLTTVMAKLEYNGFHGLFPVSLTTDMKTSSEYVLTFSECYTGMNVDAVQSDGAEATVAAYQNYLTGLFDLFGFEDAATRAEAVAELCQTLAKASMPFGGHQEAVSRNDVLNLQQRSFRFRKFHVNGYLKALGFPNEVRLLLYDAELAKTVDALWTKENLELLKDYLRAGVMDGAAVYLNTDAFLVWRGYQDALNGVESGVLPSDYAVNMVEELLSWDLAKLYVERYASKTEKEEIETMTGEILTAYKRRLAQNPWLSMKSKQTALEKLNCLQVRVGYPKNIADYPDAEYEIRSTRDGGNLMEYRTGYCNRYFDTAIARIKNGEKVDKTVWSILPQTVNALYDPSTNSITIPAGFLDAPIYDQAASTEAKLGSIGTVIAHEISHALDALGSKFDPNGNLVNWWQKGDEIAFASICTRVAAAYDAVEVIPGQTVNGTLTLSENLADLSAMACVLDIAGADNPKLGELFESYARTWRTRTTEGYLKLQLRTDSHAPDKVRVNRVLANFEAFQAYYGLEPEDGMYLAPEARIGIW